jgi:hypothetical protein
MRAVQCPINHLVGNASRSRRPFVAMTLGMLQLRSFSQTFASRRDDKLARIRKILKEEEGLDSQIRNNLTERGYTAKELETLKRTGKHSFEMRRQDIHKLSLAKGPWTEEETEILKKMREDRKYPRIIAHCLARNEASVRVKIKHLSEYFQECNKAPLYEGPQALLPELESSIFRSRLETV